MLKNRRLAQLEHGHNLDELLSKADAAMYSCKKDVDRIVIASGIS